MLNSYEPIRSRHDQRPLHYPIVGALQNYSAATTRSQSQHVLRSAQLLAPNSDAQSQTNGDEVVGAGGDQLGGALRAVRSLGLAGDDLKRLLGSKIELQKLLISQLERRNAELLAEITRVRTEQQTQLSTMSALGLLPNSFSVPASIGQLMPPFEGHTLPGGAAAGAASSAAIAGSGSSSQQPFYGQTSTSQASLQQQQQQLELYAELRALRSRRDELETRMLQLKV